MKTRFHPTFFALLASSFLVLGTAQARPRVIWSIPSLTSAEAGPSKTVFIGTDGSGGASDANTSLLLSVNQETSTRTTFFRRNGFTIGSNVAIRPLAYSSENKTLFATFASPSRLMAVNPSSGRAEWDVAVPSTGFVGEVALTKEGNVIVPSLGGGVSLLNRNNGRLKWRRADLNVITADAPAIGSGGVVFVHAATILGGTSRNATTYALNSRNGTTIWGSLTGLASPTSQPIVAPKGLVIVSGNGVIAFNANNGNREWSTGTGNFGKPVIAGGYAVVANNRQLAGLRLTNGRARWVRSIPAPTSDPVLADNGLVLIGTGNAVQAFDPKSGRVKWRITTTGTVREITTKGKLYFCALSNTDTGRISQLVAIRE